VRALVHGAEWNVWTNGAGSDRTLGELRKAVEAVQIVSGIFWDMKSVLWEQVLTFRVNLLAHPSR